MLTPIQSPREYPGVSRTATAVADLVMGRALVRRAVARGVVGTPKSGKSREIPLNEKVLAALKRQRHLRGELVFCDDAGRMVPRRCSP
jgi:integrase